MKKKCFLLIHSEEYKARAEACIESIEEHYSNEYDVVVSRAEELPQLYKDMLQNICANRPSEVLKCFDLGYEEVIFTGADTIFYSNALKEYCKEEENWYTSPEAYFVTHMKSPPPLDGKSPIFDPSINSDLVLWKRNEVTSDFLKKQFNFLKTNCVAREGHFYDQTYLNLAHNKLVCETIVSPAVNVAFYNLHDTGVRETVAAREVVSFQFSGFDFDNPERISKHQNRYKMVDIPGLDWYINDYIRRVEKFK